MKFSVMLRCIAFLLLLSACTDTEIIYVTKNSPPAPPPNDTTEFVELHIVSRQISATPTDSIQLGVAAVVSFDAYAVSKDGSFKNVTNEALWKIDDQSVAEVNNEGELLSLKIGNTNLVAQLDELESNAIDVTVVPTSLVSIEISAPQTRLAKGLSTSLTATGFYSDGSVYNISDYVSWSVNDTRVANVDQFGELLAVGAGGAQVAAQLGQMTSKELLVSVTNAQLTDIQIIAKQSRSLL